MSGTSGGTQESLSWGVGQRIDGGKVLWIWIVIF